jgi:hypothetical protein
MNRKDFGNVVLKMFARHGFSGNIISTTNKNIAASAALSRNNRDNSTKSATRCGTVSLNKFFTIKF